MKNQQKFVRKNFRTFYDIVYDIDTFRQLIGASYLKHKIQKNFLVSSFLNSQYKFNVSWTWLCCKMTSLINKSADWSHNYSLNSITFNHRADSQSWMFVMMFWHNDDQTDMCWMGNPFFSMHHFTFWTCIISRFNKTWLQECDSLRLARKGINTIG